MDGQTPKFSICNEIVPEIYASDFTFYSLLLKSYENKAELLMKREAQKHLSSFTESSKRKVKISPAERRTRNDFSAPKDQFAKFLEKRFKLRNDYDKQHVDEFLLSKEQAFKFPSRDDDIID